jgi:ATP-dependent exoDNAse (exonuclease V) beta subunit
MREPCDQAVRERAVNHLDTTFLVEAGAGTGKTHLLVDRYVSCLLDCGSIRHVVAITFTEKAAGELRLRIRSHLRGLVDTADQSSDKRRKLAEALRDIDQAPISTIHSFAGRLLRESPVEARVDPAFRQLDALGSRLLFDQLWEEWLDEVLSSGSEVARAAAGIRGLLDAGMSVASLAEVARKVFESRFDVPVHSRTPAIDFARLRGGVAQRAAVLLQALQDQVDYACQNCRDETDRGYLKAVACARHIEVLRDALGGSVHQLVAAVAAVTPVPASAGAQACWGGKAGKADFQGRCAPVRDTQAQILADYGDAVAGAVLASAWEFSDWAAHEQLAHGYLDFADLLGRLRGALRDDLLLRERWQQAFDYLLVDEFQDTDPLQAEIVLFLAEDGPRAADWRHVALKPGKLFVVGDPKQSIYRFRRADIAMYDDVKLLIESGGGEVLPVQQNFRTVPSVVDWVNARFAVAIGADAAPRRQPDYQSLVAFREEPAPAAHTGARELHAGAEAVAYAEVPAAHTGAPALRVLLICGPPLEDGSADALRDAEARGLAAALVQGVAEKAWRVRDREAEAAADAPEVWRTARWADVTVLLRASTGLESYERALRRARVPYRMEAGKAFYQKREVRDALLGLRAIADAADPLAVYGALHSTLFGFTDDRLYLFHVAGGRFDYLAEQPPAADPEIVGALAALRDVHGLIHLRPIDDVLAELLRRTAAYEASAAWGDASGQAVRNFDKLLQKARAFAAQEQAGLSAFVRWAEEQLTAADESESQPDDDADAVRIMTMHSAKGLEFPIAVVAGGCFAGRGTESTGVLVDRDRGRLEVAVRLTQVGSPYGPTVPEIRAATRGHGALLAAEKDMEASERRRLLYVAATRAMDLLVVTLPGWPAKSKAGALLEPLAGSLPDPQTVTEPTACSGALATPVTVGAVAASPPEPALCLADALRARSAFAAEHAHCAVSAGRPLAVTSPSRLEDLEFRELQDDEQRLALAGARRVALALGSAVHSVMEHVPLGSAGAAQVPAEVGERIASLAAEAVAELAPDADAGLPERVSAYATACWLSVPVRQAAASSQLYRELSLCVRVPPAGDAQAEGADAETPLLEGFCDLLYRAPDGWVVVDYKTDRRVDDESVRRQYELQAGAYALAVEQITGERVSRACFVLAGAARPAQPAPLVEFSITADLLAKVRARIAHAVIEDAPVAD